MVNVVKIYINIELTEELSFTFYLHLLQQMVLLLFLSQFLSKGETRIKFPKIMVNILDQLPYYCKLSRRPFPKEKEKQGKK